MNPCEFATGRRCDVIDAVFAELSIGLQTPECPYCYYSKNRREACAIYEAACQYEADEEDE